VGQVVPKAAHEESTHREQNHPEHEVRVLHGDSFGGAEVQDTERVKDQGHKEGRGESPH